MAHFNKSPYPRLIFQCCLLSQLQLGLQFILFMDRFHTKAEHSQCPSLTLTQPKPQNNHRKAEDTARSHLGQPTCAPGLHLSCLNQARLTAWWTPARCDPWKLHKPANNVSCPGLNTQHEFNCLSKSKRNSKFRDTSEPPTCQDQESVEFCFR